MENQELTDLTRCLGRPNRRVTDLTRPLAPTTRRGAASTGALPRSRPIEGQLRIRALQTDENASQYAHGLADPSQRETQAVAQLPLPSVARGKLAHPRPDSRGVSNRRHSDAHRVCRSNQADLAFTPGAESSSRSAATAMNTAPQIVPRALSPTRFARPTAGGRSGRSSVSTIRFAATPSACIAGSLNRCNTSTTSYRWRLTLI